jgi:hypothetical protein
MLRRILAVGLLLTGALLTTGCCCHKWCGKSSASSAPPCGAAPAPCCPGPPPCSTVPPPPVTSGYAPPVVAIPAH